VVGGAIGPTDIANDITSDKCIRYSYPRMYTIELWCFYPGLSPATGYGFDS
jgi:hypothetical protein